MKAHLFSTVLLLPLLAGSVFAANPDPVVIRSTRSGAWSKGTTWEGGKVPGAGVRVLIRPTHRVLYDVQTDQAIRSLHVAGTLRFATDRDTRLDVGLIVVQTHEKIAEEGFDCVGHQPKVKGHPANTRGVLEVGGPNKPIEPDHKAVIRLVHFKGMDRESLPAIVCCGGQMDFHGAPMKHTWVRLGGPVSAGDTAVTLFEPVTDWRVGDQVLITTTVRPSMFDPKARRLFRTVRDNTQTEERKIVAVKGKQLTLDRPLKFAHRCQGPYRGEVANLSRNVIVESADPKGTRGHTMYHRHSAGSIAYAEFRHLGKKGVLGRYSIHFHLVRDSMRGSSVIGASIWDSQNRWITIHGTDYLVVRDCVGYNSLGHGFFLEDGTEVFNVLDRNLAIQARLTEPLPKQALPFDMNDGAGFWWGNCLNTFTRNVATECDQHGFRFEMTQTKDFTPVLRVPGSDGKLRKMDVRTLPFVRFEDNEAHSHRRFALNLGGFRGVAKIEDFAGKYGYNQQLVTTGDVLGVGPDRHHPFVIKNFRVWATHWVYHGGCPNVLIDGLDVENSNYVFWRSRINGHEYKNVSLTNIHRKMMHNPWGGNPDADDSYRHVLRPRDDLAPTTVITHVRPRKDGKVQVLGITADNGKVKEVLVNGKKARATRPNFAEWEITLSGMAQGKLSAHAVDVAGNVEPRPHVTRISRK